MSKRIISFFTAVSLAMCLLSLRVYNIANSSYAYAQRSGNTVSLSVGKRRGTFYDCNMKPLINEESENIAAIVPTTQALAALNRYFSADEAGALMKRLSKGYPIAAAVGDDFSASNGVHIFKVKKRYSQRQTAEHIIGYLDSGEANGITGLEKAYNEWLKKSAGEITLTYDVDASGRVLAGNEPVITGENTDSERGVKLTINKQIQAYAQAAAEKLPAGAIVVTDVRNGAVRAMVSTPGFDPNNISKSLNDLDSPFINRAMQGYSLGSVFKIVSAVCALENDVDLSEPFVCGGSIQVGEKTFGCYDGTAHGEINLETALQKSCNSYFISLAQTIGKEKLLKTAQKLGFGQSCELAPGYFSSGGLLPGAAQVDSPAAAANLAFGQGDLLATPLQVAGMIACVANGGYYVRPQLVEGLVSDNGELTSKVVQPDKVRVMSAQTAETVKGYLINAVEFGYGTLAKPIEGGAGGKTATAQSGWYKNSQEVVHTWFAGFYPAQSPRYAIVVMNEDGKFGSSDCGPVFKEIANRICLAENS